MSSLIKIRPAEDEQTDVTKLEVTFRNFAEAPKIYR
jgi:hypothetical protein